MSAESMALLTFQEKVLCHSNNDEMQEGCGDGGKRILNECDQAAQIRNLLVRKEMGQLLE